MKKIVFIIPILLITLIVTGCNGNITRELRHSGFTITSNEFICSDLISKNEKQTAPEQIKYLDDSFAVSESGKVYDISLSQKYSNNENCRRVNTTFVVKAIMDNNIFKAEDGKLYYSSSNDGTQAYTEVTQNDNSYEIYNILFAEAGVKKIVTVDQNEGIYYVLLDDGNVYNYIIKRDDYNSPYTLKSKNIVYSEIDYGGEIIDFYYSLSEQTKIYIQTKNDIYKMQATNGDKCNKYADVECKYELKRDEKLSKYYNDNKIVYYGEKVITSYKKVFS